MPTCQPAAASWGPLPALLGVVVALPAVMLILSGAGGWKKLALRYPCPAAPPQPCYRFGHVVFNRWCGYKGCLILATDQMGLYLSLWPFFSIGHPPIFIPWNEIQEIRRTTMWWVPVYRLVAARAPEIDVSFPERTFLRIKAQVEAARVPLRDMTAP